LKAARLRSFPKILIALHSLKRTAVRARCGPEPLR
jgi:hypothetical protein